MSKSVKVKTSRTVIIPPTVSVLCFLRCKEYLLSAVLDFFPARCRYSWTNGNLCCNFFFNRLTAQNRFKSVLPTKFDLFSTRFKSCSELSLVEVFKKQTNNSDTDQTVEPWSSLEEGCEGSYLPNCQTIFVYTLCTLSLLFCT